MMLHGLVPSCIEVFVSLAAIVLVSKRSSLVKTRSGFEFGETFWDWCSGCLDPRVGCLAVSTLIKSNRISD